MNTNNEADVVYIDEDFEDLIPEFFEDIQNDIQSMKDALGQGDYATVRSMGHSIKGAGGSYGFDVVMNIAKSLEQAGVDENPDEVQKYISELSDYLERVQVKYE